MVSKFVQNKLSCILNCITYLKQIQLISQRKYIFLFETSLFWFNFKCKYYVELDINKLGLRSSSSEALFLPPKFVMNWRSSWRLFSIEGCLQANVVLHQKSSSIKYCLPSKVIFHQMLSSIKGLLPSMVVFHQRLSSIKGRLPSNVVYHQRSSSIKGSLPSKVIFHQRLSSIKVCLPSKIVPHTGPRAFQKVSGGAARD